MRRVARTAGPPRLQDTQLQTLRALQSTPTLAAPVEVEGRDAEFVHESLVALERRLELLQDFSEAVHYIEALPADARRYGFTP